MISFDDDYPDRNFDPMQIGSGPKKPLPKGHRNAEETLATLEAVVRRYYLGDDRKPDDAMRAIVVACCDNGDVVPIFNGTTFGEEEKRVWVEQCRAMFKIWRVKHYAMFSEAWMAYQDADFDEEGNPILKDDFVQPSDDPKRIEVVMLFATDRRERVYDRSLVMHRDPESGTVTSLKLWVPEDADKITGIRRSGPFLSLLKDPPPRPHPCDSEHNARVFDGTMRLLNVAEWMRDRLGDRLEEFDRRAKTISYELASSWDRMRGLPVTNERALESAFSEFDKAMGKFRGWIGDMAPYLSPETREALQEALLREQARQGS